MKRKCKCDCCGEEYESEWTEEEAIAEYEAAFGKPFDRGEVRSVCNICYHRMGFIQVT